MAKIGRSMKKRANHDYGPPSAIAAVSVCRRARAEPTRSTRPMNFARLPARPGHPRTAPTIRPHRSRHDVQLAQQEAADQAQQSTGQRDMIRLPIARPANSRRLAQSLDDVEEHRRQEDAEQRHAQHAAEHRRAQRAAHLRPGPGGEHQRHHAEDEGERGHQDRPQPQPGRLLRRLEAATGLPGAIAWRTRRSGWRSCTPGRPAPPGRSARRC